MFPGQAQGHSRPGVLTRFPEDIGRPMQIVEPTYQQHIIKPDEQNVTRGRISKRFVVDSRDRDVQKYPTPSEYRIAIPAEYRNVISVELVQGIIPRNPYTISKNCNQLWFEESYGDCLIAEVPPGQYCIEDLLEALENAMNDVGSSTYRLVLIPNQNKIRIDSDLNGGDGLFRLLLTMPGNHNQAIARSIGPKLGFGLSDVVETEGCVVHVHENIITGRYTRFKSDFKIGDKFRFSSDICNTYQVLAIPDDCTLIVDRDVVNWECDEHLISASHTGCFPYNLSSTPYVILDIEELHKINSNNKNLDDAFAIIPFDCDCEGYSVINNGSLPKQREITYFNPPEGRLRWLTIKFLTHDGEPYDFAGREHVLDFEIRALNQTGKYNLIGDN